MIKKYQEGISLQDCSCPFYCQFQILRNATMMDIPGGFFVSFSSEQYYFSKKKKKQEE